LQHTLNDPEPLLIDGGNVSQKGTGFPSGKKIQIVQVLRGVAVMMVIIFHLKGIMKPDDYLKKEMDFLFDNGAAGVDLFFIISGFIIVFVTRNAAGGLASARNFLIKRVLRIWPLYIIATLTSAFITSYWHISFETIIRIAKSLFFVPSSYEGPPYFGYAYLNVGWSLNFEMYFYLLVAISLLAGKYRWYVFALLITGTLVILPLAFGKLTSFPVDSYNYQSLIINLITNPIIWEFIYGVVIGLLYLNPLFSSVLHTLFRNKAVMSTVLVLAVWQYLSGFYANHGPFNWGFGMGILFLGLIFHDARQKAWYPGWLVYFGDISFSIYLWHMPVAAAIVLLFKKLGYPLFSSGTPAFLLTIAITLIASHISYRFVEGKIHAWLIKKFKV
jgi:exopolysaccharide production protein ExoZ